MALGRRTKFLIWLILVAVASGVAWIGHGFFSAFYRFATEDKISGTYLPVVMALYDFQSDAGVPATNLSQLVPRYLAKIPSAPVADSVTYRVLSNGTNREIRVHSCTLKPARVYVHRSGGVFTPEEERRKLTAFHGWVALKEEKPRKNARGRRSPEQRYSLLQPRGVMLRAGLSPPERLSEFVGVGEPKYREETNDGRLADFGNRIYQVCSAPTHHRRLA